MAGRVVACHRCRHYYVTWIPAFPYGCRAMGFQSRRPPNEEVRRAMAGGDCLLFDPRPRSPAPPKKENPVRGGA